MPYYTLSGKITQLVILYYTLSGTNIRIKNENRSEEHTSELQSQTHNITPEKV